MNIKTKAAIAATVVVGIAIACLNPRAGFSDGKFFALSCSTKYFFMPKTVMEEGYTLPAGVYTPDTYVTKLMPQAMAAYTRETAGNPFQGLGLMIMPAMKEPMVMVINQGIEDACAGNDISYLKAFSSLAN